jgi:4'-phosphopantetheinyl transferase EntD
VREALFPEGVVFVRATPELDGLPLHPAEAAVAARMGAERRREFALGRACAHLALARLGVEDAPVLRARGRAPRWPDGVIGSLTHTDAFCAVVVARSGALLALGLDAESGHITPRAARRVLSDDERARLDALPASADVHYETLAFSAKESVYKALFPLSGQKLGFADASIAVDPAARRFHVALQGERRSALPPGALLEGRYAWEGDTVVTSLVVRTG